MKRVVTLLLIIASSITIIPQMAMGQDEQQFNPINTGMSTLTIAPDARAGGMGDVGAATDPDVNSQYWNVAKYAFAYSGAGASLSYTPWLRKLVSDMNISYLSGYKKFGYDQKQAVSGSLTYFSMGEIAMTDANYNIINTINPYEMAADLGYSRQLSEKFSMGVVFRYMMSDLGISDETGNTAGSAFGADVAAYYTSYPIIGRNECQWSWGINVSNIGTKISYGNDYEPLFIPTKLRIGTSFLFPLADYNTLSLNVDLSKLLVPAKPLQSNYETDSAFVQAENEYYDMSPITGIFNSFYDAPGGLEEELREIDIAVGAEYSYNRQFFVRAGYFHRDDYKGSQQYFTMGAGFSLNVFKLDAAYVVSTSQTSPLDQTLRFSLSFDMDGINELLGYR